MNTKDFLLVCYFIIVIIGIFLGFGEKRKIVVFKNYDDLGLTFLVPASYFLIIYIFTWIGISYKIANFVAWIVVGVIMIKIFINTYLDNNRQILKTLLAFITKIPLGVIFVFHLLNIIYPDGKTQKQKRENREKSLAILILLTPIIGGLVVEKKGKFFNPKNVLKYKRVGNIRKYL